LKTYFDLESVPDASPAGRVVAIGVFDGVHRGHQRILAEAAAAGHERGADVMAITFRPHPDAVLRNKPAPRLLTTLERKSELVEALGVDEMLVIKFDREFAKLSPSDFCHRVLSKHLGACMVFVGENFRFGHLGSGTPDDLRRFGGSHGFEVGTVPLAEDGGETISSTRIREMITAGHVAEAGSLLGRPHRIEDVVVKGVGRGRSLEAPTANLAVEPETAVPHQGVYVTRSVVDGTRIHPSITSIGTNPTFEVDKKTRIETLFLDGNDNVYGCHLAVDFLEHIRAQQTFPNADALAARIKKDVDIARGYLEARKDLV
jgi:riboflavin kinase / FMN adenylyltransferase